MGVGHSKTGHLRHEARILKDKLELVLTELITAPRRLFSNWGPCRAGSSNPVGGGLAPSNMPRLGDKYLSRLVAREQWLRGNYS